MTPDWDRPGLVPELLVSDLRVSLAFWVGVLGFVVGYDRPEDGFALIARDGTEFMLEQWNPADHGSWLTGPLERPFGRGINFEITVGRLEPLLSALDAAGASFFLPVEERWYRAGDLEVGVRQFLVQDPDGYLLRFSEPLGTRPRQPEGNPPGGEQPAPRRWD